ncbi:MAG: NHLP family bacteriocin export ABC transporter peptidase/permease/ATPase subunit [Thermincola sp.]|jgi:NHLM bacteriocin system ABC transporter peptidase/ATP-binding protein|nr:NHLP family bacteriocin export ABC transporter peptidase/permease/ATPase subunit [Thermincola sp.]MDT3702980.1 NHLP family bacteriocin export ABC transporter peptidase/permease/ATPase subunit [Thermincola sp.]
MEAAEQVNNKRVKTPTVLQMEAVECGAASLAIVLGYFGRSVPLEELRIACGVSRDGSKASNVLKAARTFGLTAKGFRKEPADLREIPLPAIIHWNFNHFLVLEGFKSGRVYLNDPAMGPRVVTEEEFDQSFTGVVLTFVPGPDFVQGGDKQNVVKALQKRFRGSVPALTFVVLVGLLLVIPGLVIPVFSRIFIDQVLLGGMTNWLVPLLIGLGLTALLRGGLSWLQQYYLLRMETKIALKSSGEFLWHVLGLPIDFFSQRQTGEIASRVMLNDRVANLLSRQMATTALNLVMVVFYLFLMFQYNVLLTIVGVTTAVFNLWFLKYTSRRRTDMNLRLISEAGKLQGTSMGGLQLIETLKATGSESDFFEKWAGHQAKLMNAEQEIGYSNRLLAAVPAFLNSLNSIIILALGGWQVMNGMMTIGMLVAFQSLMSSFISPVNQIVEMGGALQEVSATMNRLDDVFNNPVARRDGLEASTEAGEAAPSGQKLTGRVELRNVTFGYSRLEPPLIENFSLELAPGARVALIGGSGSGKSTIAKVISGLYEPWSGEILFDGTKRSALPPGVIFNSLAVVDQDINIFEGTLRDNLTLFDDIVPETEIIRAAKDASIHETISVRDGGYDARMEESGRNFSGGQLQRFEIARALVNNPTILVLDEATSALDPKTEQMVDQSIRRRGCTCVIVAHRLSTIRDCDEIIVLERGKVVQRGSHDELKDITGHYRDLISAQ